MQVLVNTSIINKETTNISNYLTDLTKEIGEFKTNIETLGSSWGGSEYTTFKNKMNGFLTDLNNVSAALESYNTALKGYSDAYYNLNEKYNKR